MKKFLILFLLVLSISCTDNKSENPDLIEYVPQNAALILELEHPDSWLSNLDNIPFLTENKLQPDLSHLKYFPNENPAMVAFFNTEDEISFAYISTGDLSKVELDSIPNKKVETITSDNHTSIKKYDLDGITTFAIQMDNVFVLSDSQKVLENNFNKPNPAALEHAKDFAKARKASSPTKASVFINHTVFPDFFQHFFPKQQLPLAKFSNWTGLDLDLESNALKWNGITSASDSSSRLINIFMEVPPTQNDLALLASNNSLGFFSFTYSDFSKLKTHLQDFQGKKAETSPSEESNLLENASEAGIIYLKNASVFAIKSNDIEASRLTLNHDQNQVSAFREIPIFQYSNGKQFKMILEPLVSLENFKYYLFLDRFILFSEDLSALKEMVKDFQNKNTLGHQETYLSSQQNLSSKASLLWVSNNKNFQSVLKSKASESYAEKIQNIGFSDHPFAALQLIYQKDYAHVHALLQKTGAVSNPKDIQQETSISLPEKLAIPPVLFQNHRSHELDIAVQDKNNILYLVSNQGKVFWKKKLDYRILGKIQEVDLYKNGRIQLAFATAHAVHVIDRDGNEVKPFPLAFNDKITQPLAIFDYSNNRDYRFVVLQNRNVYMYNGKGNRMHGFTFTKAASKIIAPPKHIRLGTKDYILIPESSGKLNILNRLGKTRVPVKEKIDFSENEWYGYKNLFISSNVEGDLVKIDQNGKISKEKQQLSENHGLTATAKTLVTLSENKLTIKGKTVTLDYGLYKEPQIFYIHNKIYVSTTDLQSHRVFLFDSNANLLLGFPIYGNSSIDLRTAKSSTQLELLVQGEDKTLLLYKL